jgi:hypothetical protein
MNSPGWTSAIAELDLGTLARFRRHSGAEKEKAADL